MTATPETAAQPETANAKLDPALVKLIVILLTGAIPTLLDTSIVNVAIDTIGRDLHTTESSIQWLITGYLLAFGMVIPVSGWTLARFGGRRMWMLSLAAFLAGSVACGAAWNIGSLIVFRVLQGLGGGLLLPLLTTLLTQAAGGRNLGRLMASVSLPIAVVPVFGPVLSGLIIDHFSWRWIFYVNVPICLAGLVLAWRGLPPDAGRAERPHLDLLGLGMLCPALALLLYGLAEVSATAGFGHPRVIVPLAAGAALLAAFVWHALRSTRPPAVDLRLFRQRGFACASSLLFLAGLSIYGAMLLLPLFFQQARGYTALAAGLLLVPQGVGSILPRTLAGKLTDRLGPRPVVLAGVVLAALGTVPFALTGLQHNDVALCAALVVRGAGLGAATIAVMAGAFQGLDRQDLPHASSATRIVQQVGGAFGAAVLVVILASQGAGPAAGGLALGYSRTFWWCVGFTALAAVPALLLPARREEAGPRPG